MGALRIVGGAWRGVALEAPAGRDTRPTTDRTREQVASMVLSSFGLELAGVRVLDAFAGSGALGLEMLSRGADVACLVERDGRAAAVVRRNVAAVGAGGRARVVIGDVFRLAEAGRLAGPFGLLLLDPPYATEAARVAGLVATLAARGALEPGARIVYERAAGAAGLSGSGLRTVKSKDRGVTGVDLLVWEPGRGDGGEGDVTVRDGVGEMREA